MSGNADLFCDFVEWVLEEELDIMMRNYQVRVVAEEEENED